MKNNNFGFEWNEDKAEINIQKQRVSFCEAASVFDDIFAVTANDKEHSNNEQRFYMIGYSNNNRIVPCHTLKEIII